MPPFMTVFWILKNAEGDAEHHRPDDHDADGLAQAS